MQAEKAKQSKAVSCEALQHLLVSYSRRCLFVLKTFKYLKKQCFIPTKLQGFVYAKNVSNFLPLSEILLQFCRIYIQLHRKIVGIFPITFTLNFCTAKHLKTIWWKQDRWIARDVITLLAKPLDVKIADQRYVNTCKNSDSEDIARIFRL